MLIFFFKKPFRIIKVIKFSPNIINQYTLLISICLLDSGDNVFPISETFLLSLRYSTEDIIVHSGFQGITYSKFQSQ